MAITGGGEKRGRIYDDDVKWGRKEGIFITMT